VIRTLRDGERPPEGEPRRYKNSHGYIRLRWRVAPGEFVEIYEHRYVTGAKAGEQVHHLNGVRDDNRLENLELIDPTAHAQHHNPSRLDAAEIVALYRSGLSTPEVGRAVGCNPATVYRLLVREGVTPRSLSESQKHPLPLERILEMKESGWSNRGIARELGCSPSAIDARVRGLVA
jgi:hypothetical protein